MEFTPTKYQKVILKKIANGEIRHIYDFCRIMCSTIKTKLEDNSPGPTIITAISLHIHFKKGDIIHEPVDTDDLITKLNAFIDAVDRLGGPAFVNTLHNIPVNMNEIKLLPIFSVAQNKKVFVTKALEIIRLALDKEFVPKDGLFEAIQRDFLSQDAYLKKLEFEQAVKNEERALKAEAHSKKIAYIALAISVLMPLATFILQYFTFTKERKVTLINPPTLSDTLNVYVTNPDNLVEKTPEILKQKVKVAAK